MKLKAAELSKTHQVLSKFIEEKRNFPVKAKYRLARLYASLEKEFQAIESSRMELVKKHGTAKEDGWLVPPENIAKFQEDWLSILEEELEVAFDPIKFSVFDDSDNSVISIEELLILDPFIEDK